MAELIRTSRCLETKVTPALFPPGWLEKTSRDPELARKELLWLTRELNRVKTENSTVRKQRDELEHDKAKLYHRLDQENARCRRIECDHENTQKTLQSLKKFRLHLENTVREVQVALDKSNVDAQTLRHQIRKLETKLRAGQRGVSSVNAMSAMKKLALDRGVGKRLAAATHPDKVPVELNAPASELFRFVQEIREQSQTLL